MCNTFYKIKLELITFFNFLFQKKRLLWKIMIDYWLTDFNWFLAFYFYFPSISFDKGTKTFEFRAWHLNGIDFLFCFPYAEARCVLEKLLFKSFLFSVPARIKYCNIICNIGKIKIYSLLFGILFDIKKIFVCLNTIENVIKFLQAKFIKKFSNSTLFFLTCNLLFRCFISNPSLFGRACPWWVFTF